VKPLHVLIALQLAAIVVFGAITAWKSEMFSPIDEAAHFDYVERISRGELPRQGQRLTQTTLRELACRGSELTGVRAPACNTRHLRYDQFSATYQYEAQQPPTYYAVTLPIRWVLEKLGVDDQLRATRLVGIVWLAAGLLLLWGAGRVMGIDPLPLGAGLLLIAVSPVVLYGTATVTNDVTATFAAGLIALVAALTYRRGLRRAALALFAAGFVAAACKTSNLFPVAAVSGLFAVRAIAARAAAEGWTSTARRWLPDGGALLLGGLLAAGLWTLVHRSRSLIDLTDEPTFEGLRTGSRTLGLVIQEATSLLQPLTGLSGGFVALSPDTLGQNAQVPFKTALGLLLIAAGLAGLFVTPRRWPQALGLIAVPMLYVGGVVFGVGLMRTYDIDPGLSGRYGLSMAPLLILVLAASLTGKWARWTVTAFAGCYFLTTFVVMVS
jgi:hypothetical protein